MSTSTRFQEKKAEETPLSGEDQPNSTSTAHQCPKCQSKGLLTCKHYHNLCKGDSLCKKKIFKDGYCSLHLPKLPKKTSPRRDPQEELERQERIHRIQEAQRQRAEWIEQEIFRLKSLANYSDPDRNIALEEFLMKIALEEEDANIRLEEEFEETLRYHKQQFQQQQQQQRRHFTQSKFGFAKADTSSSHRKSHRSSSKSDSSDGDEETKKPSSSSNHPKVKLPYSIKALFETLEIHPTKNITEIRMAYKKCAVKYHPDKNYEEDATMKFQTLSSAYEEIMNYLEEEGKSNDEK